MKPLISKENAQNRPETIQRGQVLGVSAFREQIGNSAAKRRCPLCPVCLAVTRTANKQNPAERYLVQVKSNLAPMGSAILFEVADKGVNFLDELELSAEDAFSASAPRMGRPNDREEAATDFIRSLLADGRRLASDCEAKLEAAGFKKSTYKKSKKKAGVRSVKDGFLWYWTLPEVEKPIENGREVTDEDDLPI